MKRLQIRAISEMLPTEWVVDLNERHESLERLITIEFAETGFYDIAGFKKLELTQKLSNVIEPELIMDENQDDGVLRATSTIPVSKFDLVRPYYGLEYAREQAVQALAQIAEKYKLNARALNIRAFHIRGKVQASRIREEQAKMQSNKDDDGDVLRNFELLKEALKTKTVDVNLGPPEWILIEHDDYHARYVGRTEDGKQLFLAPIFTKNDFIALFLFNDAGDLVDSRVEDLGPRETLDLELARTRRDECLARLGEIEYQAIRVKPFAVEHHGEMMGLIPSKYDDYWTVEVLPGNVMAFHEPWDSGEYDT